jgi:hypothetical protein
MSLVGILLGLLDIAIAVLILVLIGALALWIFGMLGWPIPQQVQRIYLAIVAVIALAMLISLLLGVPRFQILHVSAATGSLTDAREASAAV